MSIRFKRNTKYPSTQKPGVFAFSSSLDDVGNDMNQEIWNTLSGIDEAEQNKFAFSLGSWVEFSRSNRRIQVVDSNQANFQNTRIDAEPVEPQPITEPDGFIQNTLENASIQEPDFDYDSSQNEIEGILYSSRAEARAARSPLKAFKATGNIAELTRDQDESYTPDIDYEVRAVGPNLHTTRWVHLNKKGVKSPEGDWIWYPTEFIQPTDSNYPNEIYGRWYPADSTIITDAAPPSGDIISGLATLTPKKYIETIDEEDLLLFHEVGSENYKKTSSPNKIYFSVNFFRNIESDAGSFRYHVLEWGDEEDRLSNQEILESEFFEAYETDDEEMNKAKFKKLMQVFSKSRSVAHMAELESGGGTRAFYDQNPELLSHIYAEPGIKQIKTIVFRVSTGASFIVETYLLITNIFISDPNESIQNFSIFGANDFTVLPLKNKQELIIGAVDKTSDYSTSLLNIKKDDLYESQDYLEKKYNDEFYPLVNEERYGKYAGLLDLGMTRFFTKPYDIYDFISADKLEWITIGSGSLPINSSATDILIDNEDCTIELNPKQIDNLIIENTAKSSEKGVVLGDYKIEKKKGERLKKSDNMKISEIEKKLNRQAF